ncbi:MAG: DUF488 family protein [Acidimicrobiia bacterium]
MTRVLFTVGHGTLESEAFSRLLRNAGVRRLVDIRSFPGSRRHPQFNREGMAGWLAEAGFSYRWEPRLGGRRRERPESPNEGLRNPSFRAYADHMRTPEFSAGLHQLLGEASPTVCMCAESLWWRCHRRLVADAAALREQAEVLHLLHDGTSQPHPVTEGCRIDAEGLLVYG